MQKSSQSAYNNQCCVTRCINVYFVFIFNTEYEKYEMLKA